MIFFKVRNFPWYILGKVYIYVCVCVCVCVYILYYTVIIYLYTIFYCITILYIERDLVFSYFLIYNSLELFLLDFCAVNLS